MIRVLVVDDDFMVAKVHSGYVSRTEGFAVVGVAHTGADALRLARELKPDLVLLDVYLPDLDGLSVLRELRATEDVDVILITAATDVETVRRAMRGGVLHYLIKPFEYASLRDQLTHFATLHRRLDRLAEAGQADVDQVFGARPNAKPSLPKGLTVQTARLVETALRGAPAGISASECAEATGVARVSARRYLEHFVATGKAEVNLKYGGTGRPERRYLWS
ncbi:two-component system response regulator [Amycolatopsis coloradensis]|uniref:Transcriptional regulatory protein n=1 Tax=Amycolatopsis coloradensis TaxID=76021 RepID=A0A1R0KV52_9PSEU|nr:response regulator [Amycolatopsis coloradensis]OLZ52520.1 two-component system response regulator [Amycolatopsis coloradensis]